jgi:uncharacterized protein (TIGR02246 family)
MKAILLLLALSLIPLVSTAQDKSGDREQDHEALRSLKTEALAAINAKDMDKLASLFTEDFAFTGSDQTTVTGKDEIIAYYNRLLIDEGAPLKDIKATAEASILTRFIDEKSGYVYGTGEDTYTLANGTSISANNAWTALVVKEDGQWKIAAAHVGINFYDNPVVKKLAGYTTKLAVGTGIVGLIIGFLLGRRGKKRV